MKRFLLIIMILFCLAFTVSCTSEQSGALLPAQTGTAKPSVSPTQTLPVPSKTKPIQSAASTPEQKPQYTYFAEGTKIYKASDNENTVIYDANDYYNDVEIILSNLITQDYLFFTESSGTKDENGSFNFDMTHFIVRIDTDGENRRILNNMEGPIGFSNLVSFSDRLFYIVDGFDSCGIGDVGKDGKTRNMLDMKSYAAQFGAEPYYGHVGIRSDEEFLYLEVSLIFQDNVNVSGNYSTHYLRIDKDLNIEKIPPPEDIYWTDGKKIFMESSADGESSVVYDAADYYACDVKIFYLQADEDALYFIERTEFGGHLDVIIRFTKDDKQRLILTYSSREKADPNINYSQIAVCENKVFYIENYEKNSGFGNINTNIGYLSKDGSELGFIDFSEISSQLKVDNMRYSASMYSSGNYIIADIIFYTCNGASTKYCSLKIDEDLNIEIID